MKIPRARLRAIRAILSAAAICLIMAGMQRPAVSAPVNTLPKFKLKLVSGKVVDSKDLQGKVIVIDFWGTWCGPCLMEIPGYNRFYGEYKGKKVEFLALAADSGTPDEVWAAAKRLKIDYPVAAPTWEELDLFGNIEVFPTTLIFDSNGKLVKEFMGVSPNKNAVLRQTVDQLLSSK